MLELVSDTHLLEMKESVEKVEYSNSKVNNKHETNPAVDKDSKLF